MFGASARTLFGSVPQNVMDDKQQTIGLTELLDEIGRDLDEFRKKHASDYAVKTTTVWWEMERERLVMRHGSTAAVKRLLKVRSLKRLMIGFFAGCVAVIVATIISRVLLP